MDSLVIAVWMIILYGVVVPVKMKKTIIIILGILLISIVSAVTLERESRQGLK